jgi:hypothetical protein
MYPQTPANPQGSNQLENNPNSFQIQELQRQIAAQAYRIADLEARLPNTNLISPNYLTRAFAVWGHYFVSNLILGVIFGCIGLAIGTLLALVFGVSMAEIMNNF